MPAPAATLHLSDVITDVKRAFGDEDGVQVSDTDIVRWTNAGQREIVSNNPILKAKGVITTSVGNNVYSMPADVYKIESIKYDNQLLVAVGFEEALAQYGPFAADTGSPQNWYTWGNEIYVYPIPDAAKSLTIYYSEAPATVSSPNDLLGIPDQYFNALTEFVKMQAYELDEDWQAQQAKTNKFEFHMSRLKGSENNIQGRGHVIYDPDMEMYY